MNPKERVEEIIRVYTHGNGFVKPCKWCKQTYEITLRRIMAGEI